MVFFPLRVAGFQQLRHSLAPVFQSLFTGHGMQSFFRSNTLLPVCLALILAACGQPGGGPDTASGAVWREFVNADGSVTAIPAKPERILSTSVTVTGVLLAIDAPLAASAAAADGSFFSQWQPIARERGVTKLWPAGEVDLEAAMTLAPDLIVVSSTGGDSARHALAELQAIAPTIVVDYSTQSWQSLAARLGEATGLENRARQRIDNFNRYLAEARDRLEPPPGKVNIVSYHGPGISNPIATNAGVHGKLLKALGFTLEEPDPAWHSPGWGERKDFVRAQYEHLTLLKAPTTFLTRKTDDQVSDFLNDPVLANLPSVQTGQVYGLGANSFRIDYYSSLEIIDGMLARFGR